VELFHVRTGPQGPNVSVLLQQVIVDSDPSVNCNFNSNWEMQINCNCSSNGINTPVNNTKNNE